MFDFTRCISALTLLAYCSLARYTSAQNSSTSNRNVIVSTEANRPPSVSAKDGKDHLVKQVDVSYPPIAAAAHVSGVIAGGAEIDLNGNLTQVVTLSGPELLRSAALESVQQYKYRPFVIDGVPTVVRTAVQVFFYPGHAKSN